MGLPVLLLTTKGRKSGREHTVHLGYFEDAGAYVVAASSAVFFGRPSAWLLNLEADPRVSIQLGGRRVAGEARVATPQERARLWQRLLDLSPGYAEYQKRTSRPIAMASLRPINGL